MVEDLLNWAIEEPELILAGGFSAVGTAATLSVYSSRKYFEGTEEVKELYEDFEEGKTNKENLDDEYWSLLGEGIDQLSLTERSLRPYKNKKFSKYLTHRVERNKRGWET